jgi:hypothetical protein
LRVRARVAGYVQLGVHERRSAELLDWTGWGYIGLHWTCADFLDRSHISRSEELWSTSAMRH